MQKISGTERLWVRRRSDEGETAERDDSRIKRIVFAVRHGVVVVVMAELGDGESEKY